MDMIELSLGVKAYGSNTLSGVTAHEQLQTGLGRSPRRPNLAVKVNRNLPCCRVTPGKWYVHAHQVKIETDYDGKLWSRSLKTKRLISILRSVFGRAYFPRPNTRKPTTQPRRARVEPKKASIAQYTTPTTTTLPTPIPILPNNFSLPMQAPPPWANPAFYIGQTPYTGAYIWQCPKSSKARGKPCDTKKN